MGTIRNCWATGLLLFAALAGAQQPLLQGINHTPIVVGDLEKAAADFHAMGFTIKPGHVHPDGIRNVHIKFADRSELELITAPREVDDLTSEYRKRIAHGDGPVYYGLHTPDPQSLLRKIRAAGIPMKDDNGLLTFPAAHALHALFFGIRAPAPTDRSEDFAHANSAQRLSAFWVRDRPELHALLRHLGVPLIAATPCGPLTGKVTLARLPEGDVYLVPSTRSADVLAARLDVASIAVAGPD